MRLFGAIALGAIGVVLLIAGANGSAQQLYTSVFGKGLSGKTDIPDPNVIAGHGSALPYPVGVPSSGGNAPRNEPGLYQGPGFNGVNTLTGAGIVA